MGAGTAGSGAPDDASVEPLPWPVLDPWPAGWLGDTPAEAVARWRARSPAQRFAALQRTRVTAFHLLLAGERMRNPALDDEALRMRVRARLSRAGV